MVTAHGVDGDADLQCLTPHTGVCSETYSSSTARTGREL
jgi:hypothetical protein